MRELENLVNYAMIDTFSLYFQRSKLGGNLTKLTLETFLEWKKRKVENLKLEGNYRIG